MVVDVACCNQVCNRGPRNVAEVKSVELLACRSWLLRIIFIYVRHDVFHVGLEDYGTIIPL